MRAGDTVRHRPTGEVWVLAFAEGNDVAPCGWPPCMGKVIDCDLVRACSDGEHRRMLEHWTVKGGDDFRARAARRQLFELNKGYVGAGI